MSAPQPPIVHALTCLTLSTGGAAVRSGRRRQLRTERGERRELEPRGEEIEIGITSRRRPGRSALRRDLVRDRLRIAPTAQSDRQQASSIGEPFTHEQLEPKAQLRLVRARPEVGHAVSLLTQRRQVGDELLEPCRIGMQQEMAPDDPERRATATRRIIGITRELVLGFCQAIGIVRLLQPGTGAGNGLGTGDRCERAEPSTMPKQPLGIGPELQSERAVQQAGAFGADAKRRALESRREIGGAGAQRVAPKQGGKLVRGGERVGGFADRGKMQRNLADISSGETRETLRRRHRIDRPVAIDEISAIRGRRGEDRV